MKINESKVYSGKKLKFLLEEISGEYKKKEFNHF